MEQTISLITWKSLVEKKIGKKILIKIIWNDQEKLTLFITPNMKINSFIYDEKEGYLFYDQEGKAITYTIPSILPEKVLDNGQLPFSALKTENVAINQQPLTKEDILYLQGER